MLLICLNSTMRYHSFLVFVLAFFLITVSLMSSNIVISGARHLLEESSPEEEPETPKPVLPAIPFLKVEIPTFPKPEKPGVPELPKKPEYPKPELPKVPKYRKSEVPKYPKPEKPELPKPEVPKGPELPKPEKPEEPEWP